MIRKPQVTSLKPRAFTLIELLVVITIIAVLLALLMPALDRAVRHHCGTAIRELIQK